MTLTGNTADAEALIRRYLVFLEDPGALRDEAEIRKAEQAVEDARDPIERLKAHAELDRARNIDETPLRQGFIHHARTWAGEQGIPVSAFRQMQVPDDVLREAGFDLPEPSNRGRAPRPAEGSSRQRARPVPAEEIKAHILGRGGTFLLADIQGAIGGSQATVRKAVDELIDAGRVDKLGPVPDWSGRGRAPVQYRARTGVPS